MAGRGSGEAIISNSEVELAEQGGCVHVSEKNRSME